MTLVIVVFLYTYTVRQQSVIEFSALLHHSALVYIITIMYLVHVRQSFVHIHLSGGTEQGGGGRGTTQKSSEKQY